MGDRKARLAALASKAGRTNKLEDAVPENDLSQSAADSKPQSLSFRNYAPSDEKLGKGRYDGNAESPAKRQRVEEKAPPAKSALQDALQQAKQEIASSTHPTQSSGPNKGTTQGPKKINWDLKRDIQGKLAKLEKRTQKAIVEMLRERLEKEATEQADDSDLD